METTRSGQKRYRFHLQYYHDQMRGHVAVISSKVVKNYLVDFEGRGLLRSCFYLITDNEQVNSTMCVK